MLKTMFKVAVITGAVAAGVATARKLGLAEKAAKLVDVVADKASTVAEEAVVKVVLITDKLLTKFDEATSHDGLFLKDETPEENEVNVDVPQQRLRPPAGYGDVTSSDGREAGTR